MIGFSEAISKVVDLNFTIGSETTCFMHAFNRTELVFYWIGPEVAAADVD